MNWMWGRWWEKWEVKEEERLLAQASVRMEFLLIGMEKAGGEAVLGRRWEFGIGLARCVSFHLMQAARAPEVVGRQSISWAWKASAGAPETLQMVPSLSRGQFVAQLATF